MSALSQLALPHIPALAAYTPGLQPTEDGWVKLNTNESPYPPSPRVAEAVARAMGKDGASLRLYPPPTSAALRERVASVNGHGLRAENVIIGNGSDDLLNLVARVFCGGKSPLGFTMPSYSLYPVLVAIQDGAAEVIEFGRDMKLPVEKIAASKAKAFVLTSPNAPTGVAFPNTELERVLQSFGGLLVVDEAYAPFAGENAVPLLAKYPRLLVTRTLSKAHALAGIRVGYALGHPEIIALLDRVRDSYNVSALSQVAAIAALGDGAYYAGTIAKTKATRDAALAHYTRLGWFTYPSQTNFIFTEPRDARGETGPAVARSLYEFFLTQKILVRHFAGHPLTAGFLRISVGTDADMAAVNNAIASWHTTNAPRP
ncbi:MAG: histidinol-phosphate transaminase [Opitutaceae bacterium]|jgi:histidinol-phosphate aminotransferase|nr:histidinol-phosphate transaminase [Opitutaceae bacterium]